MINALMQWWKGYSESDLLSLSRKLAGDEAKRPDGLIEITPREARALSEYGRRRYGAV